MMKIKYMKPAMRKVEIQPRHFLLQSPGNLNGMKISIQRGSGDLIEDVDEITNEEDII